MNDQKIECEQKIENEINEYVLKINELHKEFKLFVNKLIEFNSMYTDFKDDELVEKLKEKEYSEFMVLNTENDKIKKTLEKLNDDMQNNFQELEKIRKNASLEHSTDWDILKGKYEKEYKYFKETIYRYRESIFNTDLHTDEQKARNLIDTIQILNTNSSNIFDEIDSNTTSISKTLKEEIILTNYDKKMPKFIDELNLKFELLTNSTSTVQNYIDTVILHMTDIKNMSSYNNFDNDLKQNCKKELKQNKAHSETLTKKESIIDGLRKLYEQKKTEIKNVETEIILNNIDEFTCYSPNDLTTINSLIQDDSFSVIYSNGTYSKLKTKDIKQEPKKKLINIIKNVTNEVNFSVNDEVIDRDKLMEKLLLKNSSPIILKLNDGEAEPNQFICRDDFNSDNTGPLSVMKYRVTNLYNKKKIVLVTDFLKFHLLFSLELPSFENIIIATVAILSIILFVYIFKIYCIGNDKQGRIDEIISYYPIFYRMSLLDYYNTTIQKHVDNKSANIETRMIYYTRIFCLEENQTTNVTHTVENHEIIFNNLNKILTFLNKINEKLKENLTINLSGKDLKQRHKILKIIKDLDNTCIDQGDGKRLHRDWLTDLFFEDNEETHLEWRDYEEITTRTNKFITSKKKEVNKIIRKFVS